LSLIVGYLRTHRNLIDLKEEQQDPNKQGENNNLVPKPRVMIVDDNKDILRTLKLGLEDSGFSIEAYAEPLTVLSIFKTIYGNRNVSSIQMPYDLLLIDVKMPELNGVELTKEITKLAMDANAIPPPICFITAFDEYYEILMDLFPNNRRDSDICLIHKPIEIDNLTTRLKHEIALHK
jgi:DNA-binding response OmpR family regulator